MAPCACDCQPPGAALSPGRGPAPPPTTTPPAGHRGGPGGVAESSTGTRVAPAVWGPDRALARAGQACPTITGVILVWVFVRREANVSRLQSDFVSKVSHELRTPLTSIRLFSETLARRPNDPEVLEKCVAALEKESLRLQELIDRLLVQVVNVQHGLLQNIKYLFLVL